MKPWMKENIGLVIGAVVGVALIMLGQHMRISDTNRHEDRIEELESDLVECRESAGGELQRGIEIGFRDGLDVGHGLGVQNTLWPREEGE